MPDGSATPSSGNLFEWSFACDLDLVREAAKGARAFLAEHHVGDMDLMACELAMVEACNNAVLYTQPALQHLPILLRLFCHGEQLEIQVTDHSPGFEWPDEVELPAEDAEHGRGLYIIKSVMDETFYQRSRKQNTLVMRKKLVSGDICRDDKTGSLESRTKDSLIKSEQAVSSMATALHAHHHPADDHALARELQIARNIQESLLPRSFPSLPGFSLSGFCINARQVGGDFYDVLPLDNSKIMLVIADVMGKGVPAALFAATLRTLVRTLVDWTRSPAELLERMNRLLHAELSGVDMFITAQLALVDVSKREITVANAGHCPLLIASPKSGPITLAPDGLPLGIMADARYAQETLPLDEGCSVVLYTDGLTEARNSAGEFFGPQRLADWLTCALLKRESAEHMSQRFLTELMHFQAQESLKDDQTMLVLTDNAPRKLIVTDTIMPASPALAAAALTATTTPATLAADS